MRDDGAGERAVKEGELWLLHARSGRSTLAPIEPKKASHPASHGGTPARKYAKPWDPHAPAEEPEAPASVDETKLGQEGIHYGFASGFNNR